MTDFHIEISGFTGNDTSCLIGLDDVEINALDHCRSELIFI